MCYPSKILTKDSAFNKYLKKYNIQYNIYPIFLAVVWMWTSLLLFYIYIILHLLLGCETFYF